LAKVTAEAQYPGYKCSMPHTGSLMLFQLSQQLRRQPAGMLHIVNHGTLPRPGLDQAEPALGSCNYGV